LQFRRGLVRSNAVLNHRDSASSTSPPDKTSPTLGRSCIVIFIGKDLYRIPMVQHGTQWHKTTINPCTNGSMAYLCMHTIGKVHWGGARGQGLDFTFGREHINF